MWLLLALCCAAWVGLMLVRKWRELQVREQDERDVVSVAAAVVDAVIVGLGAGIGTAGVVLFADALLARLFL